MDDAVTQSHTGDIGEGTPRAVAVLGGGRHHQQGDAEHGGDRQHEADRLLGVLDYSPEEADHQAGDGAAEDVEGRRNMLAGCIAAILDPLAQTDHEESDGEEDQQVPAASPDERPHGPVTRHLDRVGDRNPHQGHDLGPVLGQEAGPPVDEDSDPGEDHQRDVFHGERSLVVNSRGPRWPSGARTHEPSTKHQVCQPGV